MATASFEPPSVGIEVDVSRKPNSSLKPDSDLSTFIEDAFTMPKFDPAIHLAFEPPTARHSFTELGLAKPDNVPDMCFTEPFQLFSEEGVRMLRREIFRKEFLDKYMRSWERAPCYIGGHTNHPNVRYCPLYCICKPC